MKITVLQIMLVLAIIDAILSSIMIGIGAVVDNELGVIGIIGGLIIFVFSLWVVSYVERKGCGL